MATNEPLRFGRKVFRIVVALLATTFIYDLLWLFLLRNSQAEDAENGGQGGFIRGFCTMMAYLSFFFRIVVIAVFWKVSLNYSKIIRQPAIDDEEIGSPQYQQAKENDAVMRNFEQYQQ